MTAFVEAHQFKGVESPGKNMTLPPGLDPTTIQTLMALPPFTRAVSMHFSNGKYFDVQQDKNGTQYLVLDREQDVRGNFTTSARVKVFIGEWIALMPDGSYMKLTDAQATSMGVQESPYVPAPPQTQW